MSFNNLIKMGRNLSSLFEEQIENQELQIRHVFSYILIPLLSNVSHQDIYHAMQAVTDDVYTLIIQIDRERDTFIIHSRTKTKFRTLIKPYIHKQIGSMYIGSLIPSSTAVLFVIQYSASHRGNLRSNIAFIFPLSHQLVI